MRTAWDSKELSLLDRIHSFDSVWKLFFDWFSCLNSHLRFAVPRNDLHQQLCSWSWFVRFKWVTSDHAEIKTALPDSMAHKSMQSMQCGQWNRLHLVCVHCFYSIYVTPRRLDCGMSQVTKRTAESKHWEAFQWCKYEKQVCLAVQFAGANLDQVIAVVFLWAPTKQHSTWIRCSPLRVPRRMIKQTNAQRSGSCKDKDKEWEQKRLKVNNP